MIVLVPSRVFSSVDVITHGSQRERGTTVNAKRRKDQTAKQYGQAWKSHLFGTSPLLVTVLLLSALNSGYWLLEEEPREIFGTSSCDCLPGV